MAGMHSNFGVMVNPRNWGNKKGIKEGRFWALDNDCFNGGFNPNRFFFKINQLQPWIDNCMFLVCPDVVGNARATIELWYEWSDVIRQYGPLAFVAQNGQESLPFPNEDDWDWLFIGGDDDFKLGDAGKECIRYAKALMKPVHVGRVNSIGRFRYFQKLGVDSADGSLSNFNPGRARRLFTNAVSQLPFRYLISSSNYHGESNGGVVRSESDDT